MKKWLPAITGQLVQPYSLDMGDYEVEIRPKPIRTIRLAVHPPNGRVTLSVPKGLGPSRALDFLNDKKSWIHKQRSKILSAGYAQEPKMESGAVHRFFGMDYVLHIQVQQTRRARVLCNRQDMRLELTLPGTTTTEKKRSLLYQFYAKELMNVLPALFEKWQRIIGVHCSEYRLKRMKTRWGTCNTVAGRIWINTELAKKSWDCIEYIVVHELVHLLEPSHNKRFVAFMNQFLPNWKQRKAELNHQ